MIFKFIVQTQFLPNVMYFYLFLPVSHFPTQNIFTQYYMCCYAISRIQRKEKQQMHLSML